MNNVAIAAKYAFKVKGVKRILIFDWDVHHGNSTYEIYKDDPNVLFISLHRYDNGLYYPGKIGALENIGGGKAAGTKVHVPWSMGCQSHLIGTSEYIHIFEKLLFPICQEFNPDLVFISAGFDSMKGDPLGSLSVEPPGYEYMTKRLKQLNKGKVIICLEGGYSPELIS